MKNPPRFSLRTTLVVPFVLQLAAAVGLVSWLSFRSGQQSVRDLSSQLRTEMSSRIEGELRSYFEEPADFNAINAATFAQRQFNIAAPTNAVQFSQQLDVSRFIFASYCGDQQGNYLGAIRFEDNTSMIAMEVANAATGNHLLEYGIDAFGNRKSLLKTYSQYDPRKRPWYIAAAKAGHPIWSEVYLDFTTGLPTITASQPVYQPKNNQLIGVCATDVVLLQSFHEFLSSLSIGKSGRAFVIDRSGQLISSSTKEPLTTGEGNNARLLEATTSSEPVVNQTANFLKQKFGDFRQIQQFQQLDFYIHNQRQLVQVMPFQAGKGLDWLIVVTLPESDLMGRINANTRSTIWLTLAALGLTIAIGIFTSRWIINPMRRLTKASEELADGKLGQRVDTRDFIDIEEIETLEQSFNKMAIQLQESFEQLEDRVKERTAELATANEAIVALNEKLKEENLRMGAELNVARQIQSMILPKPEELNIAELDIACYMEPADEVGGDYYDVLNTDGVVTFGIGDVTGHGLESGILMLMTQTAVRTLQEIREANPVRFLDTLNRTIYKNVQRMDSEKSLTLLIVNYTDGKISISGQHEETLLVRSDGKVERIDTMDLGFPIGLDSEIADFISHATFELQPGDGIVLYTDGIPEARNIDKMQYGVERLCEVISANWQKSAQELKDTIVADVRRHIDQQKVFDDITLLVVKRV